MKLRKEEYTGSDGASAFPVIDFHSHILPCMDDGSASLEESLALLEAAHAEGIKAIVATPHFYPDEESPRSFLKRRRKACELLLSAYDPEVHPTVYIGAEVAYFNGIGRSRYMRDLAIEGTNVILVEMPFSEWSESFVEEIRFLRESLGMIPVIAHIERYLKYQKKGTLKKLLTGGALIQSNATNFIDIKTVKTAMKMLLRNDIHLLGSDCHNTENRPQNLRSALSVIASKKGSGCLEQMSSLAEFLLADAIAIDQEKNI